MAITLGQVAALAEPMEHAADVELLHHSIPILDRISDEMAADDAS